MELEVKIKNIIDNCRIEELIQVVKNNIKFINLELTINKKSNHWIYYLYDRCGKDSVKVLLDSNIVDSNDLRNKNNTSLVWQAYADQKDDLVKLLLNHGASSILDKGFTLLHWVSSNGDIQILKIILLNNININIKDIVNNDEDRTPLHWAAQENQVEAGILLLKYGANIEATDIDGKTPLHIASSEGNNEFVDFLIKKGANKDPKDNFQITPKKYAELYGHVKLKTKLEKLSRGV